MECSSVGLTKLKEIRCIIEDASFVLAPDPDVLTLAYLLLMKAGLRQDRIFEVFVLKIGLDMLSQPIQKAIIFCTSPMDQNFCQYLPVGRLVIGSHQMIPHWTTAVIPIELGVMDIMIILCLLFPRPKSTMSTEREYDQA